MLFKRPKGRGLLATDQPKNLFASAAPQGVASPIHLPPMEEVPSSDIRGLNLGMRPSGLEGAPMMDAAPPQPVQRAPTPREQFDYDGAVRQMEKNNKGAAWADRFARAAAFMDGDWGRAAEITGRMAGRASDTKNQAIKWQRDDWVDQRQADLQAMHPTTVGRARVVYDPITRESQEVYRGPEDFEIYADRMGAEPGTQQYHDLQEDYVLRSSGPSAFGRDVQLDDHKTDNDARLEGIRHRNRASLEGTRQQNRMTLRNTPTPPRGGVGNAPRTAKPITARDKNGRTMELRNGQWVLVR